LVEVVVDGRTNGCEFLQTSHLPEAQHGPLSSSKRKVGILGAVVPPATGLLTICLANHLHRSTVRSEIIRRYDFRVAVSFHQFPQEIQRCFAIATLGDMAFQYLTFVIYGPPKIVSIPVDFHDNFVQMLLPI